MNDRRNQRDGGDAQELSTLFEAQAGYVRRVLRSFRVPERDVADVSQDVFVNVCRKLDSFEGRSSIRTWFYRICARAAIDYHRRAHRRHERLSVPPERSEDPSQIDELTKRRTASAIHAALDELSPDKRAVFVLYELDEMTMAEIALLMRCPLQTAFARLYAARRHVNRALASAGWAGGAALAVGAPARTAWASAPALHAIVNTWRATLPDVFTLAKVGAQGVTVSHGFSFAVVAAIALSVQVAAPAGEPSPHAAPAAQIGVIHAVVVQNPLE